ncbi:MAG: DUF4982 domain-containing protein, partial [Oscillospiraceae bacterium]|nr:DUF4982 domain-containing protein [Oscillospiraceae bacterium]
VELENRSAYPTPCRLEAAIYGMDGEEVGSVRTDLEAKGWGRTDGALTVSLRGCRLWSPDDPYLYKAVTTVSVGGGPADRTETAFGIRGARFDPDEGFILNGKAVKLKGVCCHQDHAGVGIGVPDAVNEYRIRRLKEMGCNAYRCAHHPPSSALLDICDRLGMLVMDETRLLSSGEGPIGELRSMVRRDRNHPSVVIWSLGNEEFHIQKKASAVRIMGTLTDEVRALDPTRPVTLAVVFLDDKGWTEGLDEAMLPLCGGLEVMGFNYTHAFWDKYREAFPRQPIVVTEASSGLRTRGGYASDEGRCVVFAMGEAKPESRHAEEQWKAVAESPYMSGIFLWTGFDYRGEPVPCTWPAVSSQFGVMDTCGFAKDNFFYYKSWWSDEAVLHIFPHWDWPGCEGRPIDVYCYSNCGEVELFVNGRSQGRKAMERNCLLKWEGVAYEPGVLRAEGVRGGVKLACERRTSGAPARVMVTPERARLKADGQDVSMVTVSVVDEGGAVVPTAGNLIRFEVGGEGRLLGTGNGDPADHMPDRGGCRRAYCGLAQIIVQAGTKAGTVRILAHADGLYPGEASIEAHA